MVFALKRNYLFVLILFICTFLSCAHNIQEIKSLNGKAPKEHIELASIAMIKTIYVDDRFNFNERAAVRDAGTAWEKASYGLIRFNFIYDYDVKIKKIHSKIVIVDLAADDDITKAIEEKRGETFVSGYIKNVDGEFILICAERISDPADLYTTIQKELGHELGLHDIEGYAIMSSTENGANCPTIYDMQEFCRQFVCSIDEVRYCK